MVGGGGHGILPLSASSHEGVGGGAEKNVTPPGGLE